jgi:hypothetical protein
VSKTDVRTHVAERVKLALDAADHLASTIAHGKAAMVPRSDLAIDARRSESI